MNESIIIGFSRPVSRSIISWAIRTVENTDYSHTYIKFYSASMDRWMVYHASQDDCHFTNYPSFLKNNKVVEEYEIACTQEQKTAILQMCVDKVGLKYGKWQIVGMGIARMARLWFNANVKNPFRDGERTVVCSELVGHALRLLGEEIKDEDLEIEGPRWIRGKVIDLAERQAEVA